jgi:hypothetical protein
MRQLIVLAALSFATDQVQADAGPPPPPKGKKYVGVENSVAIDKSVSGYVFAMTVAESNGGRRPNIRYASIKLGEKPTVLSAGGKPGTNTVTAIVAIPTEEAKKYGTEKEMIDALAAGSIPGTHRLAFTYTDTISADDKRETIPWKYTIEAIDAKTGIAAKKERDGKAFDPKEAGEDSDGKRRDNEPLASGSTNGSRTMFIGLFLAAAFVSLGLWLASRQQQE